MMGYCYDIGSIMFNVCMHIKVLLHRSASLLVRIYDLVSSPKPEPDSQHMFCSFQSMQPQLVEPKKILRPFFSRFVVLCK